jgi:hypothetical protein
LRHATALKTDKFVLIAHDSIDETTRALKILGHTKAESLEHHEANVPALAETR